MGQAGVLRPPPAACAYAVGQLVEALQSPGILAERDTETVVSEAERAGVPLLPQPAASLVADVGPWSGFALAADAVVGDLHSRFGFDLWLVTHVDQDRQVVVASAGPWAGMISPAVVLPWAKSFCVRMVEHDGPVVVADVARSADYGPIAIGAYAGVQAYLGVPVLSTDGTLFGTLCAFAGQPEPSSMPAALGQVNLVGRMLSTIAAGEQIAVDRSNEAARAYAFAELDRLTGLRNRRGWEAARGTEEQRARRYGSPVSVVVVDLDDLKGINDTAGHAAGDAALVACGQALQDVCRPADTVARTGGDEFSVLAVQCDAVSAVALARRARVQLRAAGVAASVGVAARRPQEGLEDTWRRADQAMYRDKRRRPPMSSRSPRTP